VEPDERPLRSHYERHAAVVFGVTALSMVIVCGAVVVSGWFPGVMTDRWERLFWAGAITAALAPRRSRRRLSDRATVWRSGGSAR
jgi:hypothetical protein